MHMPHADAPCLLVLWYAPFTCTGQSFQPALVQSISANPGTQGWISIQHTKHMHSGLELDVRNCSVVWNTVRNVMP